MSKKTTNDGNRLSWLRKTLADLPEGIRILDAGAGELRNRPHCSHLRYVSQDFCQYQAGASSSEGLHSSWDTSRVDLVCDITAIPEPEASFDAILCSEVLEHLPEPVAALKEFARLLRRGGKLILTAPFASLVHMGPYYYYSGFSKYWYEYHLPRCGMRILDLEANGGWFDYLQQETRRLGAMARRHGDFAWPIGYAIGYISDLYFRHRNGGEAADLACFGYHCLGERL